MRNGLISHVEPGSAAFDGGIVPGDCLLSVNEQKIQDVFDYRFLTTEEFVSLKLEDANGEEYYVDIEKDAEEDLGLEFVNPMMAEDRACANHCVFCFIDQMPPGMRDTLYFKDDDPRLSFLTGNYVTLTNIPERELHRIVQYRMSPINVSVHTTNPELRVKMLGHKKAGDVLKKIDILREGCIAVNAQIVLCPGYNDGEELDRTLADLSARADCIASVSVVPVGITKYREGLAPLRVFTKEECRQAISQVERWQQRIYKEKGTRFVYAADELYLKADLPLPEYDTYEDFPQLENGVGMCALLDFEVCDIIARAGTRLAKRYAQAAPRKVTLATGKAAYPVIKGLAEYVMKHFTHLQAETVAIENHFFGEDVTVAGLITGQDLRRQLEDRDLGDALLITQNMLRAGEDVFLDDLHVSDIERELGIPVIPVPDSGEAFVQAMIGGKV